jgi:hypothetical protein
MTPNGTPNPPTTAPDAKPDPMRRIFEGVLRALLVSTGVITLVALPGGYVVDGWAGLLGALLGAVVALVFTGTTALSMLLALHKPLTVLAGVVLGAWVGKMIVLVAALAVLQDMTFYNKTVFVVVLFVAVVTSMVIDVRAVVRARIPNVDPASGGAPN